MAIFRPVGWPGGQRRGVDDMERMRRDMERLFQGFSGWPFGEETAGVFPLTNVTQDENSYYVRAELPGMAPDQIEISVTGDSISISGERKISAEKKEVKYHRREREAGKFSRIVSLPGQIQSEKVQASYVDGILTIVVPKAEIVKPKQIKVKTG